MFRGRAGVVLDQLALYATAGLYTDITYGGMEAFFGGGVEYMAMDNMSVRAQVVTIPDFGGDLIATAGVFWHMH